jgi:hypothetical protein
MTTPGDNPVNPLYAKIIGFEGDAIGWARDATLLEILNRSDFTNTILSEYVKKVAPDLAAKIERAESKGAATVSKSLDEQTEVEKKLAKDREKADIDQKQALYDLKNTLRGRLDTIKSALKSTDPGLLAGMIGQQAEKIGSTAGQRLGQTLGGARGAVFGRVIGVAAGMVIGASLMRTLEVSKTFGDLYDTGVSFNGSMTEMIKSTMGAGQSIEAMAPQLTKFSDTVAALGADRMVKFGKTMLDATRSGAEFGMTNDQLREGAYEYLEIMTRTGQISSMTAGDLQKGSYDYLQNLTALSLLTGQSRKAEAEANRARQSDARMRAARQLMTPEQRAKLTKLEAAAPTAEIKALVGKMYAERALGRAILSPEERGGAAIGFDRDKLMGMMEAADDTSTSMEELRSKVIDTVSNITDAGASAALSSKTYGAAILSMYDYNLKLKGVNDLVKERMETEGLTHDEALKRLIDERKIDPETQRLLEIKNKAEQTMSTTKGAADLALVSSTESFAKMLSDLAGNMREPTQAVIGYLNQFGDGINKVLGKMGIETGIGSTETGLLTGAAGVAAGYAGSKYVAGRFSPAAGELPKPPITEAPPKPPAVGAGSKALNLAKTGLKIGGVGSVISGVSEYMTSGNLIKSLTVGGGSLIGGAIGTIAGGAAGSVVPVAGTAAGGVAGGIAGSVIGESAGRWLYEKLVSEPSTPKVTPTIEPATKAIQDKSAATAKIASTVSATAPETKETADPVILARKSMEYYETARAASQNMIDLLAQMNEKLEMIQQATREQTSELGRSYSKAGTIF